MNFFASISLESLVAYTGSVISLLSMAFVLLMKAKLRSQSNAEARLTVTVMDKDGRRTEYTIEKDDLEKRFRDLHPKSEPGTSAVSH
jgi:hypothetical protein